MKKTFLKLVETVKANKRNIICATLCVLLLLSSLTACRSNDGTHAPSSETDKSTQTVSTGGTTGSVTADEQSATTTTVTEGDVEGESSSNVSSATTTSKTEVESNTKATSTTVTSSKKTEVDVTKATSTTTEKPKTTTAAKPVHKHNYSTKTVEATCTKGGYTLHSCKCGHSYKDNETAALGHLYLDWVVTKQATTNSTGVKECACDRCGGGTLTETIPKKETVSDIDPKVEIGIAKWTSFPEYTLGNCAVVDKRTWGDRPTITVYNGNCMQVTYYNKQNEKVAFNVEHPGEGYINTFTIRDDGTYVSQYFGSYS